MVVGIIFSTVKKTISKRHLEKHDLCVRIDRERTKNEGNFYP